MTLAIGMRFKVSVGTPTPLALTGCCILWNRESSQQTPQEKAQNRTIESPDILSVIYEKRLLTAACEIFSAFLHQGQDQ